MAAAIATTFLLLSALLCGAASAQGSESAPPEEPDLPAQPWTPSPPPEPDAALPPQSTDESGRRPNALTLAVGVGYGVASGTLYSPPTDVSVLPTSNFDPSMRDTVSGQLPFSMSVDYRPIPLLSFGVALGYAHVFLKDAPFGGSGSDQRLGGELRLHIVRARLFGLWASAGLGYEWFSYVKSPSGESTDVNASGLDLDFQAGGDLSMTGPFTVGPFVGLRVGTFRHFRTKCGSYGCGAATDVDVPGGNLAAHEWLTIGVRGTFTVDVR